MRNRIYKMLHLYNSGLGCCSSSEYGCCPDNETPAEGPYGEGCDCR